MIEFKGEWLTNNCDERRSKLYVSPDSFNSSSSYRFVLGQFMKGEKVDFYICKYGNEAYDTTKVKEPYPHSPESEYVACRFLKDVCLRLNYDIPAIQDVDLGKDENGRLFCACKITRNIVTSMYNVSKNTRVKLIGKYLSYSKAMTIIENFKAYCEGYPNWTYEDENKRTYGRYLALSMLVGNRDLNATNYSFNRRGHCVYLYDFDESLQHTWSNELWEIFYDSSTVKKKDIIMNGVWDYLDDNDKETSLYEVLKNCKHKDIKYFADAVREVVSLNIEDAIEECVKYEFDTKRENYYKDYIYHCWLCMKEAIENYDKSKSGKAIKEFDKI